MKLRKALALFLVFAMMATSVIGCSKGGDDKAAGNNTSSETSNGDGKDTTSTGEVVTLKWISVGNGMPKNYENWLAKINPYLAEKIGVNIDVEIVPWSDWDTRRSVIVNSGENFDILFTDGARYASEVGLGAFLDITDLVKTAAPDLYSYIPADYWDAVSVNGKVYSVPTYKDSSATQYFVWDKAIAEKYSVDYEKENTLAGLSDTFKKIKEGEGTAPVVLDKNGFEVITSVYDQMGVGLPALGVRYDDQSRKVVNVLEQEEILSQLDLLHQWYDEGIINADAPAVGEAPSYRMFYTAQGWSGAAKTTWGPNMGVEAVTGKFIDTIVSNSTVRGSLNGISANTKYPEKCLEFLQLVNLDSKVRDAFYYGLEGDNFNYNDKGEIEKLNNDWTMAGYTQGTFFNVSKLASDEFNQWDEVKELNSKANPSVLLGFNLDTSKIETELANCRSIYEKYRSELMTGAREPREMVKTISAELDASGFQTIVKEAQSQIDAMYNK
ncbi:ABC transporter substrate-binding protein [Anaerocolumna sp. MB42-C2]|uniref:ABC transporter substrate-binding protein n=1 Tax=Anaerocolumna sp. MB42-C2 TaxID=3070997 RepID=UPI0027E0E65E|nr:ABC transporter substrate-binding protein [Anaerocolumna sp. MB42-C2]WMJ88732.1 ABC transporter substrate-binding protein [Anaerocolumna sp. MB42-C2]